MDAENLRPNSSSECQELEHHSDFMSLRRCFSSWVEFTLQRRLHKQRKQKAKVYNQQRQYSSIFYTWCAKLEKHKDQMLSQQMAVLHEERCSLQRAWSYWIQRTQQHVDEEKPKASGLLYHHMLLHKTVEQREENITATDNRRKWELWAGLQSDLHHMRWAVNKWKKFVQSRRERNRRLEQMQHDHELKLLKHAFVAWKRHHLQMCQIYSCAEKLHRRQQQCVLRKLGSVCRVDAELLAESRTMEQRAHSHFEYFLQLKVFAAWRQATTRAVSKHHQQVEALTRAQSVINQVQLLGSLREWRAQTREAQRERMHMEKAKQHHETKLLSKALKAWKQHHYQYLKYKVMKRQGVMLLRLKIWQRYFEQWKTELQHRRRATKQTERALWHWSLTLQAKVLYGWRLWVAEQRCKREHAARAAQIYRDQLLREGVTNILTYAAHMNSLTSSLVQCSQAQPRAERSRHLQKVVHRCAMRWKQRALCKRGRGKEPRRLPPKKSVTFCLPAFDLKSKSHQFSQTDSETEARLLSEIQTQLTDTSGFVEAPLQSHVRMAPHQLVLCSPLHGGQHAVSCCLQPPTVPVGLKPPSTVDSLRESQDVLLPPSAFMIAGPQLMLEKTENAPLVPSHQFIPPSADGDVPKPMVQKVKDALTYPTLTLTKELLSIRLDMRSFQQDRKQLRAWRKLKEVLNAWLQTSGKDEHVEKNLVCQELKELEECIDRLSSELEKRKPTMRRHAERIKHFQTVVRASRAAVSHGQTQDMETERSVFTT